MSTPTPSRPDATSRFVWLIRTQAWIVAVAVIVLAAAPLVVLPSPVLYEAQALVVARQVVAPSKALPRLAQAVFDTGEVARRVTEDPTIGGDPTTLVPARLDVIIAEDSVVFLVVGRDHDANAAAALANVGAAAFTDELNRGGSGIAAFDIQSRAQVPSEPVPSPSTPVLVAAGALAGLLLGLGLIALLAAIRRPVIDVGDIEPILHTRVLGTVFLPPAAPTRFPGPAGVAGVAPVVRWLAGAAPGLVLVVSDSRTARLRQSLLVMLAVGLAPFRATALRSTAEIREHVALLRDSEPARPRVQAQHPGELILVDGSETPETLASGKVSVVVVVRRGTPRARVRALATDYLASELFGVILVDFRRRRAHRRNRPPAAAKRRARSAATASPGSA